MDITASVGLSLTGDELPYVADRLRADLAEHESCDLRLALGLVPVLCL